MNKTVTLALVFATSVLTSSQASSEEPICRIAAISRTYITTLTASELGERSWIAKTAPQSLDRTIAMVNATNVDAMIVLGPLTWSGSQADLEKAKSFLSQIRAPVYVIPGDKDLTNGSEDFSK